VDADVVIVGAGPAGCSAAARLAEAGLRVTLADRAVFPRDKACGDGLDHRCLDSLAESGLLEEARKLGRRMDAVQFVGPSGVSMIGQPSEVVRPEHGYGLIVPRQRLDNLLFETALSKGATEVSGFQARATSFLDSGLIVVTGERDGKSLDLTAKVVIAADGANSVVARGLGLTTEGADLTSVGMRAYFDDVPDLGDRFEVHYFDRELMPAYGWVFPISESRANVGVGIFTSDLKRLRAERHMNLDDIFKRFLSKPRFREAKQVSLARAGLLRHSGAIGRPHDRGVLLVGDAAGLVNPLTGEGLSYALSSGRLAAEAIIEAHSLLGKDLGSAGPLYHGALYARFNAELARARSLQGLMRQAGLIDRIVFRASRNRDLANVFSALIGGLIEPSARVWLRLLRGLLL
jgi:menaquinone-9 beta-reductase